MALDVCGGEEEEEAAEEEEEEPRAGAAAMLADGAVLGRIDGRLVRASTCASRSITSSSRAEATRAKELLRRHDPMTCTSVVGTLGGNSGSSRKMAAVVAEPPR